MRRTLFKIKRVFDSQRGAAAIMAAIGIIAVVIVFAAVLNSRLQIARESLQKARARITSMQVMQDFAVMAQKASDNFYQQSPLPAAGNCPGGMTPLPANRPFCWDNPVVNNCVNTPRGQVCLNAAGVRRLTVAALELKLNRQSETWGQFFEAVAAVAKDQWMGVLRGANQSAEAQLAEPWLPAIAGAPNVTMMQKCFTAGANNIDICKVCNNNNGSARVINGYNSNVDCLTLRMCPTPTGVCTNAQLYWQRIGFIPRR